MTPRKYEEVGNARFLVLFQAPGGDGEFQGRRSQGPLALGGDWA